MEFTVLGDPDGGPPLDLDHERFAYAGKFVMGDTGKAVVRTDGAVVAAAAFNRDRTDSSVVRIRYVTVRADHRGEGIGARLLGSLAEGLLREAAEVRIAVNNAFAYQAAYKAGFAYTGDRTGLAELLLTRPADRSGADYRRGIAALGERDHLTDAERTYLESLDGEPPPVIDTVGWA